MVRRASALLKYANEPGTGSSSGTEQRHSRSRATALPADASMCRSASSKACQSWSVGILRGSLPVCLYCRSEADGPKQGVRHCSGPGPEREPPPRDHWGMCGLLKSVRRPLAMAWNQPAGVRCPTRVRPRLRAPFRRANQGPLSGRTCSGCCPVSSGSSAGGWPNRQVTPAPGPMQRLLRSARWAADAARDEALRLLHRPPRHHRRGTDCGRNRPLGAVSRIS